MIHFVESNLAELSVHHVGNKTNEEYYSLSETSMHIEDEMLNQLLKQFFLSPFLKVNDVYRFTHASGELVQNEMYTIISEMFEDGGLFHGHTKKIATHLFDVATHPKVKSGELYVGFFENLQIEGELHDAIGIFRSENKESYIKVYPENGNFGISYEQAGINLSKLDKGCVIFNTENEEGYKVVVVDPTSRSSDALYWKDSFLKLKIRNDNFNQTQNVMDVYKNFVTEKLDQEFDVEKTDKIDLLNRSMKYFKEKDTFDIEEFATEVIANEEGIELFKSYKQSYEEEFDTPIADSFDISNAAVKKQAKDFKTILKLDKNFHVYIHGDKDLIEKDYDADKGMNCYKLYYKEEQ